LLLALVFPRYGVRTRSFPKFPIFSSCLYLGECFFSHRRACTVFGFMMGFCIWSCVFISGFMCVLVSCVVSCV